MAATVAVIAVLTLAGVAAGCSKDRKGLGDAPVDKNRQDDQAPYIVNMPNGFMNVALKCVAKDLLVSHTRVAAPVIVPNSSACEEGVAERLGIPRVVARG